MTNDEVRTFALDLLRADTEHEVILLLERAGFWNDPAVWRDYGDRDGNYATIGNQQSRPESALVEKVINCVDARLMNECLLRGIDPTSAVAPKSMREAVAQFFEIGPSKKTIGGRLQGWPDSRILEESRKITIAVTGNTPGEGAACLTIVDAGEGQAPSRIADTFFSIEKENKLRIPFVQGKFNMGGTGALKFCGKQCFQLLITRRNPRLTKQDRAGDSRAGQWTVSIVRRDRPQEGAGQVRNSVYRYLAPVGAAQRPRQGEVLTFTASDLPLFPDQNEPYRRMTAFGSAIKLYEYDMKGFRSHALRPDGLLYRLETMIPEIALPVRVHECRSYRGVKERSFENTLKGLTARLNEERSELFEDGFPTSVQMTVRGQNMTVQILALKHDKNADTYTGNDGLLFVVNGQTHGSLSRTFFERKQVGMQRLAKSLIVLIDCSGMSTDAREDLFMNSRDRLSNGELRSLVEDELEEIIGKHGGLKELRERRKREEVADRLQDSKPLEDVLKTILKSSPTLSRLFLAGQRLSRPRKPSGNGATGGGGGTQEGEGKFVGKPHPTFFRFLKNNDSDVLDRTGEIGRRTRIRFETDVVNDYFTRHQVPGRYRVEALEGVPAGEEISNSVSLYNGVANWSIALPDVGIKPGESLTLQLEVADDTLIDPFVNIVRLALTPHFERDTGGGGKRQERSGENKGHHGGSGLGKGTGRGDKQGNDEGGLSIPKHVEVREKDVNWVRYRFDERTACHVVDDGSSDDESSTSYTFYINLDNIYLRSEMKESDADAAAIKAKFKYANMLVALALLHEGRNNGARQQSAQDNGGMEESDQERVSRTTRALAPFLVPMIDHLGAMTEADAKRFARAGDDE